MCEYTQRRFCTVKGDDDDDEHGVYKIGRGQEKKNASSLLWIIIVTQAFAGTALSLDIAIKSGLKMKCINWSSADIIYRVKTKQPER